ncbi:hypothetical protein [Actinoplanes sp. NPDC026619]|uniref:hypothetical protein n=1 Tax=Actinoplanes sp. NPDC026619 TaxID=3155798 RepID=UPI0033C7B93F
MRGGLDDALDKLARRDELRRRAAGETSGPSPAVSELVEAIAAVVARHPHLGVTVGAEGSGEPVLLHFFFADGQVQVSADTPVATTESAPAARHADFDIDLEDPLVVVDPYSAPPASPAPAHHMSHDDQNRYGPADYGYGERYYAESDTAERRYGSFEPAEPPYPAAHDLGENSRDLGARMREMGMASRGGNPTEYPPHPFAATPPPPVPPQAQEQTRRIHAESLATDRIPQQPLRGGMPTPLPKPIPLQVERPEETEMAARRLAALLRDDPTLLNNPPS